jgi:hypothetical protein
MKKFSIELEGLNEADFAKIRQLFDLLEMTTKQVSSCDSLTISVSDELAPVVRQVASASGAAWYLIGEPAAVVVEEKPKRTVKAGPRKCVVCGDPLASTRSDSNYCTKRECRRVRDAEYTRKHFAHKTAVMEAESETNIPPTEDELPAKDGKHAAEDTVWTIQEGQRAGEKLSSREMSAALNDRLIDPGTRVMNSKRGLHIAYASPGKRALKLRQYATGVPQNIEIR